MHDVMRNALMCSCVSNEYAYKIEKLDAALAKLGRLQHLTSGTHLACGANGQTAQHHQAMLLANFCLHTVRC